MILDSSPLLKQAITGAIASIFAMGSLNLPANALTKSDVLSLSYEQVKGSGLANRCPSVIPGGKQEISVNGGKKYKVTDLCLEPTSWQVKTNRYLLFKNINRFLMLALLIST